jgi:hypothetical protein
LGKSACLLTQGHDIPADSDPLAGFATTAPRRMMPAMEDLLLRRAPAAPGEVYDILSGSRIVGRILLSDAPAASQWVWTLSYDYHEDRTPTHGNAATRDAALHAFARSWNMIRPTSSPWLAHQRPPVSQKEVRRSPTDLVEWLAG